VAAHLADMADTPNPAPGAVRAGGAAGLGTRMAVESRAQQGLGAGIADLTAADRLRGMCSLPRPRRAGSRSPHQLDPLGE
jgi:hypothetical protein